MLRRIIRRFDAFLRRQYGVYEFTDDPNELFRLQIARAPHAIKLSGGEVRIGAPILIAHLWNEHIPPFPTNRPNLQWASRTTRMLIDSYRSVARELLRDPRLINVQAIGGNTAIFLSNSGGEKLMRHLGFEIFPYHSPLGRFGAFWENFYAWWIMWAYNAPSAHRRSIASMSRFEIWMLAGDFLQRYGLL